MSKLLKKLILGNATTRTLDCYHFIINGRKLTDSMKEHLMFNLKWDTAHHNIFTDEQAVLISSEINQL